MNSGNVIGSQPLEEEKIDLALGEKVLGGSKFGVIEESKSEGPKYVMGK
jgi:hypothetical protein